jgi:hypothetical protein
MVKVSNVRMTVNHDVERTCKEAVVAYYKGVSQKPSASRSAKPKFNSETSKTRNRSVQWRLFTSRPM